MSDTGENSQLRSLIRMKSNAIGVKIVREMNWRVSIEHTEQRSHVTNSARPTCTSRFRLCFLSRFCCPRHAQSLRKFALRATVPYRRRRRRAAHGSVFSKGLMTTDCWSVGGTTVRDLRSMLGMSRVDRDPSGITGNPEHRLRTAHRESGDCLNLQIPSTSVFSSGCRKTGSGLRSRIIRI